MKEKFFAIVTLLLAPVLVYAQMDVATYNKERHQLINYHTNSEGNLESVSIVDDDMTTIMLNVDGTTRSIVNSLATMEFEYDDTELDAKYVVDGQRLSRCVYHIDEESSSHYDKPTYFAPLRPCRLRFDDFGRADGISKNIPKPRLDNEEMSRLNNILKCGEA